MFENAQQEPSGGHTRVVAGVIVVLMAVLGVWYYFNIHTAPPAATQTAAPAAAAPSGGGAPAPDADFKRDLVVQKVDLGRDQTQTMALWAFQIQNRSRTIAYKNLKYKTTYFDAGGNIVRQGAGDVPDTVDAGDLHTVTGLNDGLYPLNTSRFTVEITAADGYLP
jgi:hypothetical protein